MRCYQRHTRQSQLFRSRRTPAQGLEIANSPRSSSVGGFDAVNSKQVGHVSQGLEFFLVGTVIGFFHFDKRFRLMTLQRRKKFRSTPKVLSLQVNVYLNMPRPCTFFPRDK